MLAIKHAKLASILSQTNVANAWIIFIYIKEAVNHLARLGFIFLVVLNLVKNVIVVANHVQVQTIMTA